MNRYFGYIRVSTQKQGQQGSSLEEQRSSILRYAEREHLRIIDWYEERETAAKAGRTQFNQMLAQIELGVASGLIIHKIDRSARNLKDWARLGELIDRGCEVHFAHETIDLTSRGGRLSADIQAVVAADYVRNLRQEIRKGFYGRLHAGLYPLPAPIGYLNRGKARAKEIDPLSGPLVQLAFELYASGEYPLDRLRQELWTRGLRGRSGNVLSRTGMAVILHNTFYMGVIRLRKTGETFPGVHSPLVTKALFDQVQRVLAGKAIRGPVRHRFLFSQLLTCHGCGRTLTGELQKAMRTTAATRRGAGGLRSVKKASANSSPRTSASLCSPRWRSGT